MRTRHDEAHKRLFSHARTVEDLLRGFVAADPALAGDWLDRLDLTTLTKVAAEYISDTLVRRQGDAVWRVRFSRPPDDAGTAGGAGPPDDWLYLLVMLEFQSAVERHMGVRMLAYTALLYQETLRGATKPVDRLPAVLPVVFYTGEPRWTAPVNIGDGIVPVGPALARFQPSQAYHVVDARRYAGTGLVEGNVVSALLALELADSPTEAGPVLERLSAWLAGAEHRELRRAFVEWVKQAGPREWVDDAAWSGVTDLEEVKPMLAERIEGWFAEREQRGRRKGRKEGREEGREEGRREGREEGREEGRREGREQGREEGREEERELLRRMAAQKFGAEPAEQLHAIHADCHAPESSARPPASQHRRGGRPLPRAPGPGSRTRARRRSRP